jgi:hypothetical protein
MDKRMHEQPLEYRFDFGGKFSVSGLPQVSIDTDYLLGGKWDVEKDKSSDIRVIPSTGLVEKIKDRRLDPTVYEAFATLFFSELLGLYSTFYADRDFTLLSPQTFRIQYGDSSTWDSMASSLLQLYCAGVPFNKLKKSRKKLLQVEEESVRVEERVMYLVGILSEIFLTEGVCHGDPQLRHFFMLPRESYSYMVSPTRKVVPLETKNGIGVIDVENTRVLGQGADEVKEDVQKLVDRIFTAFNSTPRAEEYFDRGRRVLTDDPIPQPLLPFAMLRTKKLFNALFPESLVDVVDLESGRVTYHPRN